MSLWRCSRARPSPLSCSSSASSASSCRGTKCRRLRMGADHFLHLWQDAAKIQAKISGAKPCADAKFLTIRLLLLLQQQLETPGPSYSSSHMAALLAERRVKHQHQCSRYLEALLFGGHLAELVGSATAIMLVALETC